LVMPEDVQGSVPDAGQSGIVRGHAAHPDAVDLAVKRWAGGELAEDPASWTAADHLYVAAVRYLDPLQDARLTTAVAVSANNMFAGLHDLVAGTTMIEYFDAPTKQQADEPR
jgi:hypothetical protein